MQKQIGLCLGFGLVGIIVLAVSGCGGRSQSAVQPMEIASDAGSQAIAKYDANKDGFLDYDELAKAPGLRAGVAKIKNLGSGRGGKPPESQLKSAKISAEEIDARIQKWKERSTGRITLSWKVFRKKGGKSQPLADAEVKFVPEEFLGKGLTIGTGKTDKYGSVMVAQPSRGGDDPAVGMCPGYYRVEITKGSEIPAKYNKDTILGVEVASDSLDIESGQTKFELEY